MKHIMCEYRRDCGKTLNEQEKVESCVLIQNPFSCNNILNILLGKRYSFFINKLNMFNHVFPK